MTQCAPTPKMQIRLPYLLVMVFLLVLSSPLPVAAKPQNITESEMKLIPSYCPDTMGFGYGDAFYNTSPRAPHWVGLMGKGFWAMHHYCWARINMNRAQRAGVPLQNKRALWDSALNDYQYVINNVPNDFILFPEVYTRQGEVELLLGQPNQAQESFSRARQLKPDYWPAHANWAEFLIKTGKRAEALKVVIAGLEYSPNAKVLLELFKILGGKPTDIPTPKQKHEGPPPSDPVTNPEN